MLLSGRAPGPETHLKEKTMSWTAPIVVEICAGMEVTAYLTAEIASYQSALARLGGSTSSSSASSNASLFGA